jgi:hypothetical protein
MHDKSTDGNAVQRNGYPHLSFGSLELRCHFNSNMHAAIVRDT